MTLARKSGIYERRRASERANVRNYERQGASERAELRAATSLRAGGITSGDVRTDGRILRAAANDDDDDDDDDEKSKQRRAHNEGGVTAAERIRTRRGYGRKGARHRRSSVNWLGRLACFLVTTTSNKNIIIIIIITILRKKLVVKK